MSMVGIGVEPSCAETSKVYLSVDLDVGGFAAAALKRVQSECFPAEIVYIAPFSL